MTLYGGTNYELTYDRFGESNSALSLSNGYMIAPQGIYFKGDYTVMAWVKVRSFNSWSRLIDFGNGAQNDNIYIALTRGTTGYSQQTIYYSTSNYMYLASGTILELNKWQHIAFTYTYPYSRNYIDGVLVASSSSALGSVRAVIRTLNYVGKSNWNDGLANADYDELKIFDAYLSQSEIQSEMNNNFNN